MTYSREPSERNKGTLFGLVLGLIVGLAIAVLAALYITHSPKPLPRKTEISAQPASKVDPIGELELQLREIEPSVEKEKAQSQNAEPLREPAELEEVGGRKITKAPSILTPHTSQPQTQPRQTVKPPEAARPPMTSSIGNAYYLQTGAYKTQAAAEQQHARLALGGFPSKVTQRTAGSVLYYRVRLGPFTQLSEVNAVRTQLSESGIDAILIQDGKTN